MQLGSRAYRTALCVIRMPKTAFKSPQDKKEKAVSTKFVKLVKPVTLICAAIALVVALGIMHLTQAQTARASAGVADPMVLTAVDATSPSCRIHTTINPGASSSPTSTFAPCPPGSVMRTTQVPLTQARAHHWSYLPVSGATPEQIREMVETQRQMLLRAGPAPASGTQEGRIVAPNSTGPHSTGPALSGAHIMRPATCGWNVETGMDSTLNGDFVSVDAFYYYAADCSTIVLNYSITELLSPYYNPMYWEDTRYNQDTYPYCWAHNCWWGYFRQTLAPPNTTYRQDYNATEDGGHTFTEMFSTTYDPADQGSVWYYIGFNLL